MKLKIGIFVFCCLVSVVTVAGTNYVMVVNDGSVMSVKSTADVDRQKNATNAQYSADIEELFGVRHPTPGVTIWSVPDPLPKSFTNIIQAKVLIPAPMINDSDKLEWEKRFTRDERAIMAAIKLLVSKIPAQYRPTDDEFKEAIRTELKRK